MSDNDRTGNRLTRFVSTQRCIMYRARGRHRPGALHRQLGRDEPAPSLAAERAHPNRSLSSCLPRPPTDRARLRPTTPREDKKKVFAFVCLYYKLLNAAVPESNHGPSVRVRSCLGAVIFAVGLSCPFDYFRSHSAILFYPIPSGGATA
ncbi:hypothetical protein EVAR_79976_1 [Eumeta japonica]|uniref:Uncharacterized protein n=1 Tax=Eumeta variegata TaxID=151549 RepID=A0A4C2A5Q3_EUMVA|nr:hypothetical protein EVAR_79976_1 [Eumeta japonica]